jgi:N-acetylmuramoyl-L-alanine amidase
MGAVALLAAFPGIPLSAKPSAISDLHYYSSAHSTMITVELDAPVKPHTQNLENPPRIVIDLLNTRVHLEGKGTRTFSIRDGLVRRVRVAQNTPKNARLVIDLEHSASVTVTAHQRPRRLNIEVRFKAGRSASADADAPAAPAPSGRVAPALAEPAAPKHESAPQTTPAAPATHALPVHSDRPNEKPAPAAPATHALPVRSDRPAEKPAPAVVERPETALREPAPAPLKEAPAPKAAAEVSPVVDSRPVPASANAGGGRSLTRALGLKLVRVVIDAGHGGHDEGTRGPTGLLEKDLVLDVALRLGALVEQRLGAEVVYTRSEDVFIPLEERTAIANRAEADLFLSIHANSSPIKGISGSEVYFLSFATSKEAMDLAGRENAGTSRSIHELQDLLKKIALNEKVTESKEFATDVQRELFSTWNRMSGATRNRGVKKAPFVVLIGARMPSILSEVGFISNPRDEALLKKPDQRQRLAEALFRGVNAYASTLSRMDEPRITRRATR